jgi:hypothetical protein
MPQRPRTSPGPASEMGPDAGVFALDRAMPGDVPSSNESFLGLHTAGWSIGDLAVREPAGLVWLVTGTNCEHRIRAEGPTWDAWWSTAIGQVQAGG